MKLKNLLIYFVLFVGALPAIAEPPPPPQVSALRVAEEPCYKDFYVDDLADPLEAEAAARLRGIWPDAKPAIIDTAAKEFASAIHSGRATRPKWLVEQDKSFSPQWHFGAVEYMFYVDKFLTADGHKATFDDLIEMLPYWKSLGVNLLYPLPFLESPQKDAGFDVSNYMQVAAKLGGNAAFQRFMVAAKRLGMKVKMDLILNHISDEHPWFTAFLNGEMKYKDYFHVLEHPPQIVNKVTDHRGRVITYRELDERGKTVDIERRVMFPEISDTHYREVEVRMKNGKMKKFWVFYTFYPFQIDLNFEKPAVLSAFYEVVNFWVNRGIDVFRFDAIPFLNKSQESHQQTHLIVQLLNSYLRQVSPNTLIMPEACQPADIIASYFGQASVVQNQFVSRALPTTTESQIVYDFERKQYILASLVTGLKQFVNEADKRKPAAPQNSLYALPLSVHDENTLEMFRDPVVRAQVVNKLIEEGGGEIFREGLGVSGRPASLFGNDPRRVLMANALTWSAKGMPIIYYGDEQMALNDPAHAQRESIRLAEQMKAAGIQAKSSYDSRHIVRADIPIREMIAAKTGVKNEALQGIRELLAVRMRDHALVHGQELQVENDNRHVYTLLRKSQRDSTLVAINLSGKQQKVRIKFGATQLRDLITESVTQVEVDASGQWITLTLEPYAYHWLKP